MKKVRLALVGVGNVGRRLLDLVNERRNLLATRYGLEFSVNCVADSGGVIAAEDGFNVEALVAHKKAGGAVSGFAAGAVATTLEDALDNVACEILLEASPLDLETGNPGLANSRIALTRGMHLVLANKSPLALAHRELDGLAAGADVGMLYSATFCGGLPVLNVLRRDFVCGKVLGFRGIFNATSNFVLQELQAGKDYAGALAEARETGAAEADPRLDVEGWDTAAKLVIAANQFCEPMISLSDVDVTGIENIEGDRLRQCAEDGLALKLVASAKPEDDGWSFKVEPTALPADSFLGSCHGWEMGVEVESDIYGRSFYKLREGEPVPTAASMLRDAVHLATGGRTASI